MAKYDGLIIPRSYNDYINKSDPAGVAQALQLTGVMDNAPAAQSTKPAKSGGIFAANAVIISDNATLTGVTISAGSVVRVLFTADLTGSNTTTGLTLTYNGNAYAVKVGKDGTLANFYAYAVASGVFKYLQAYTTLELMFDGTQFIIIGNPGVLSNANFTIYADGSKKYTSTIFPNTVTPANRVFVWDDFQMQKDTQTSNSHTEVPVPDYTPILIYIWNPANVAQFVIARVFSQGQYGSFTVLHNTDFTISSVNHRKVTINTDLGYNLSYKYIV